MAGLDPAMSLDQARLCLTIGITGSSGAKTALRAFRPVMTT
jgi:hypothetical protein